MDMPVDAAQFLDPPVDVPEIQRGNWFTLAPDDPVVTYLTQELWDQPQAPRAWQTARLSGAVHLYREIASNWSIVAKFYKVKTGLKAEKYSTQEFNLTHQACELFCQDNQDMRVIEPVALWRGVLFLEYADGLTLEDVIAIRRSRPGTLLPSLERVAAFLARLHLVGSQPDFPENFDDEIAHAEKILRNLAEHGILEHDPLQYQGLQRLITKWSQHALMRAYTPCFSHGDATTSNFVFPWQGGLVTIDWERAGYDDPAADLGRLMAEVAHSINQHGGSPEEAQPFIQAVQDAYLAGLPATWDQAALVERARFHRAASTLRIARNGWVSRLDRTALVAQAFSLLSEI
jgi:hypothetical protein